MIKAIKQWWKVSRLEAAIAQLDALRLDDELFGALQQEILLHARKIIEKAIEEELQR